ncbi:MAG: helix-turn-helix domain-containing protein [Bacteroides sp.]|nr:helix-turn-helix domain-containing protein [Eubacterium sp.]MCM1419258.1 helix-turn-helix domain-containing protein [Roseburia sp.]MCM1461393.1 helix-turn-helix domain-containing protein [Bacteroides sp.]
MNNDFPRILSLLRKERHISQKEAAKALGVAQALLSHYEKGKRECGLDFLVRAADFYNVSTDYLLGRSPMRSGSMIAESEIPETDARERARFGADISLTLSKKLLTNSIEVIYSLLAKVGSPRLNGALTNLLNFAVYKAFRLLYRTNKNNSPMFGLSDEMSCPAAQAGEVIAQGIAEEAINVTDRDAPEISTTLIETEYPKQAPALLSLLKSSEAQLRKLL